MATERLAMHHVREILRQKLTLKRSHRAVVEALGVSMGVVSGVVTRAATLGLDWEAVEALDDEALEVRLYGPRITTRQARPLPDPAELHVELRKPGVTLQLLHLEYLERHPDGYRYTTFCGVYQRWLESRAPTMRQVHVAGDKMFVDYSGKRPHYVEPATGEVVEVELFVAVLGASSYTYAEATRTQKLADFTASNARAFTFFGGVTNAVVPDQLKSAVTIPNRYEAGVQRTFAELGRHYGTTILPARPRSPRDKAKVEVAVQVAQRWILARMRNERFDSLGALNARIAELCAELNRRVMRQYKASRLELFERLDKPALRALPAEPFEHAEWEQDEAQHRLPREGRRALLLRALHARARGAVGAVDGDDRGAVPPRHARGVAPAQQRARSPHDGRAPHAGLAPEARGVDADAHPRLGEHGGPDDGEARGGDPRRASSPGARLPIVPRAVPAREALRARSCRGGVRASARGRGPLLPARRIDPEVRPRSHACARRREARGREGGARERARLRLLPLRGKRT